MDAANAARPQRRQTIQNAAQQEECDASTIRSIRPTPTSKTSAACKPRGQVSDDAIPAATLIVVRERARLGARTADGRARRQGWRSPRARWSFPAGGSMTPTGSWAMRSASTPQPSPQSAKRSRRRRSQWRWHRCRMRRPRERFRTHSSPTSRSPALLGERGLELDAAALTLFARWVPKFHAVRRFDTLFFVARCPDGDWEPRVIEGECTGAAWLTADEVLDRDRRGEARLIFPTRRNLERLAQHAIVRRNPRRRARPSGRAGDAVGRGARRRAIHHDSRSSRLSGHRGAARRPVARLSEMPSCRHQRTRKRGPAEADPLLVSEPC